MARSSLATRAHVLGRDELTAQLEAGRKAVETLRETFELVVHRTCLLYVAFERDTPLSAERWFNLRTCRTFLHWFSNAAILLALIASSPPARAETKLSTQVFTASAGGVPGHLDRSSWATRTPCLIDGQLALATRTGSVAALLETKKTLTTVYVTHWHPDHYFGLVVVKQAFPKVKIVAQPATIARSRRPGPAKVKAVVAACSART
jgi:hypothetical protein